MIIRGEKYRFGDDDIANAPNTSGVYVLYYGSEIVYIGKATGRDTIKSKLQAHKRGNEGVCTRYATHFAREQTPSPISREKDMLREFKNINLRLPKCNEMIANRYSF